MVKFYKRKMVELYSRDEIDNYLNDGWKVEKHYTIAVPGRYKDTNTIHQVYLSKEIE